MSAFSIKSRLFAKLLLVMTNLLPLFLPLFTLFLSGFCLNDTIVFCFQIRSRQIVIIRTKNQCEVVSAMMGKTHVAIGVFSVLLLSQPTTVPECALAIAGGALGGVAADIDTVNNDYKHDALIGQVLAVTISGVMVFCNYFFGGSIATEILGTDKTVVITGAVAYFILLIKGYLSNHRTFTHSILAAILFTLSIGLICTSIAPYYLVGYLSHLFLDILNKKEVPLMYPKKKGSV